MFSRPQQTYTTVKYIALKIRKIDPTIKKK